MNMMTRLKILVYMKKKSDNKTGKPTENHIHMTHMRTIIWSHEDIS